MPDVIEILSLLDWGTLNQKMEAAGLAESEVHVKVIDWPSRTIVIGVWVRKTLVGATAKY